MLDFGLPAEQVTEATVDAFFAEIDVRARRGVWFAVHMQARAMHVFCLAASKGAIEGAIARVLLMRV